ncbi:MAG: YidC/Oxa1 family membrane protein insertase [Candidatus Wallacebacter cryptica]|nr:membrane protein insertase YidC [Bacillota bacterium]
MAWLADGLRWLFDLIVGFSNSYGIAIILVTILIRLVLLPLTFKQAKNMQLMKEIQPKLEELQKKYKDNPQELQNRTMKLYQDYKYNPFSGCLPLLVQLPILWAFFAVLRDLPQSDLAQFFYLNLTEPDPYYILPLLSVLTQFINVWQTSAGSQQRGMLMFMPLFIGWISTRLPAGLVLYWVVGNIFTILQQAWISKKFPTAPQGGQS